jgi:hypothetical protein
MLTAPLKCLKIRCPLVVRLGKTTGGYRMLNTVRGAVNIIYWWIPYA